MMTNKDISYLIIVDKNDVSSPLITINHKSSPREAELLVKNKVRHLIDTGRCMGIITPMDFTRYKQLNNNTIYGDKAEEDAVTKMLEYYED